MEYNRKCTNCLLVHVHISRDMHAQINTRLTLLSYVIKQKRCFSKLVSRLRKSYLRSAHQGAALVQEACLSSNDAMAYSFASLLWGLSAQLVCQLSNYSLQLIKVEETWKHRQFIYRDYKTLTKTKRTKRKKRVIAYTGVDVIQELLDLPAN